MPFTQKVLKLLCLLNAFLIKMYRMLANNAGGIVEMHKDLANIVDQKDFAVEKIFGTKAMAVMEVSEVKTSMSVLFQV